MRLVEGMKYSWHDLRHRRWWVWGIFLSYLPAVVVIGSLLSRLLGSDRPFMVVAAVWMVGLLVAGMRLFAYRCPRCGRAFHWRGLYGNVFTRTCLHCGLRAYAMNDGYKAANELMEPSRIMPP